MAGRVTELKGEKLEDFKNRIKEGKIVVDFSAEWCLPCQGIKPKFEKMAEEFSGITFLSVDVDDAAEIAEACREAYNLTALPTFLFFINGELQTEWTVTGDSEEKIRETLEKL